MEPAEILLNRYDQLGGAAAEYRPISAPGERPSLSVAIYRGVPDPESLVGFTIGLSHFHPPSGAGLHRELMITMDSDDEAWPLAVGFIAYKLRAECPFECGDTINFSERISQESEMSAFLVTHPIMLHEEATEIDLGIRRIRLVQLVPLYDAERQWFLAGGTQKEFLSDFKIKDLMDPTRPRCRIMGAA